VTQRVSRGIALLFLDRDTRRGWVVSSTPRPHFTPVKDPVPILQEAGWAPGPVWTGGKSLPHQDSIPNRPASSQSLYQLSYPATLYYICWCINDSRNGVREFGNEYCKRISINICELFIAKKVFCPRELFYMMKKRILKLAILLCSRMIS